MNEAIAAVRMGLRNASERRARTRRRRRRAAFAAIALTIATACTGITLAASGVFSASPAPPEVVDDFGAYATRLGFHPSSHRAQLVAVDGDDYRLYATPNREGTYCIVTATPWRPPGKDTGDGGVCVPPKKAAEPIAVGTTALSVFHTDDEPVAVLAGRVRLPHAAAIEFTDKRGDSVRKALGAGGFFVAAVPYLPCDGRSWDPVFTATDEDGAALASARITVMWVDPQHSEPGRCGGWETTPHGPYAFDEQPK